MTISPCTLRPATSDISLTTTALEAAGGVESISLAPSSVEEGTQDSTQNQTNDLNANDAVADNLPDLVDVAGMSLKGA